MYSIGPKDLIFDKNGENGIFGGGFSVNSIMMQDGISPIMTFNNNNNNKIGGGLGQVSDIFSGLAVPAYAYHNGGSKVKNNSYKNYESDDDSDEDDGVINGDLHDKLLGLVREYDIKSAGAKKKKTRRQRLGKKTTTRKKKLL